MIRKAKRLTAGDRAFHYLNNLFLVLCLAVVLFPLLNIVSQSLSSPADVVAGRVLFWPVHFSLRGYTEIIQDRNLLNGFRNSFLYTGLGTLVSVALTVTAAWPLARKGFVGKGFIIVIFTFTMLFNGGLIPTYLLVHNLGMLDKIWAMILPNALSVWNMLIARTFFQNTIPEELYEASELDGSTDIRTFFSIVLPLSKPILAVMVLFYAVGIWNSYFDALIYLSDAARFPLQLVLRNILIVSKMMTFQTASSGMDLSESFALTELLKYSVIVFASLPVMLLYPVIQKYFVKGIMIGSIKG